MENIDKSSNKFKENIVIKKNIKTKKTTLHKIEDKTKSNIIKEKDNISINEVLIRSF